MEVTKHPLVPVWDDCEDVALLSSLQFKALRKRFHLHKQRLDKVQSTLHVQRMVQEVDELHAKAQNFRLTRLRRSEEAADKLKRENMRMVGKLHTVIRDAEVRHKQLSTLSRPSTPSQGSLNISVRKQRYDQIKRENAEMVDRLRTAGPAIATAHELADRYHAHRALLSRRKRFRRQNVVRLGLPPPELQQEQVPRPPGETPSYMRPRLPPVKVEEEPPPTKPKPKPKPRAQQAAPVARAESSNEATPGEQQEAQMDERVSEQAASAPAAKGTAGAAEDPQPEGKVDGPADGDDSQQEYGEDFEEYASPAVSPTSKAATQARSKEGAASASGPITVHEDGDGEEKSEYSYEDIDDSDASDEEQALASSSRAERSATAEEEEGEEVEAAAGAAAASSAAAAARQAQQEEQDYSDWEGSDEDEQKGKQEDPAAMPAQPSVGLPLTSSLAAERSGKSAAEEEEDEVEVSYEDFEEESISYNREE
eukprot:CAMPEP_0178414302 /NCGR_PEP_ID=MMETSP0689_2-20121128/22967_1 /TAXON_ID=160604 /ORGANISM="Amphidinium massartii, Strain CS-259" /LENGTH=480 /DNA_ID=CAMNT_0020035589 /DNA_START=45 /DNA_END=1487 /DNA_ORIENTATION=-